MSDRYFLDTNIFVYCFDRSNAAKQKRAEALVDRALDDQRGVISSQVIQEFINVSTRKFSNPMTTADALNYLDAVLAPLCEVFPNVALYKRALSIHDQTRFAFYDSLMLAAALEARCRWFYSEDLQAGRSVQGLIIKNPFATVEPLKSDA